MYKPFLQIATLVGAFSVAMGAFGAHALKKMVNETIVNIFETGVRYQFYHVFAIALAGILYRDFSNKYILWSGHCFITGIVLFSGSLYALTYVKGATKPGLEWLGAITPFGGVAFIAGWIFMLIGLGVNTSSIGK